VDFLFLFFLTSHKIVFWPKNRNTFKNQCSHPRGRTKNPIKKTLTSLAPETPEQALSLLKPDPALPIKKKLVKK
jgi:hypothetical protein